MAADVVGQSQTHLHLRCPPHIRQQDQPHTHPRQKLVSNYYPASHKGSFTIQHNPRNTTSHTYTQPQKTRQGPPTQYKYLTSTRRTTTRHPHQAANLRLGAWQTIGHHQSLHLLRPHHPHPLFLKRPARDCGSRCFPPSQIQATSKEYVPIGAQPTWHVSPTDRLCFASISASMAQDETGSHYL